MSLTKLRVLTAYFSHAGNNYVNGRIVNLPVGNTEVVAKMIQEITKGDILRIEKIKPYPIDYRETVDVSREELKNDERPELISKPENIDDYDVIILGYPNWCGTSPMPVFTFLESYDFSRKIILPFCTHEGSAMGQSESDIKKVCKGAKVLKGLPIKGSRVKDAEKEVKQWLEKSNII